MTQCDPITRDADICKILTALPQKFIVDFANGIDVVRDHVRVQRRRTDMFSRLYDGFTGQGASRQSEINASLADGVEGAFNWLTELTESLNISNYAIAQVNERVSSITKNVTTLINYSADTRQQLESLSRNLNKRCDQLRQQINRIEFEQRAERQLNQVFNRWAAGSFETFSPAGRFYAALEELRWGCFGDYCRSQGHNKQSRDGFLQDLSNRAVVQLCRDASTESSSRPDIKFWVSVPVGRELVADATEALAYLGNWSNPDSHPFAYSVAHLPEKTPLRLPKLCNAKRLAQALVLEFFEDQNQCAI